MRSIFIRVLGKPEQKGSMKAFVPKGWNRPILTSDNKNLKSWEQRVATEAQAVIIKEEGWNPESAMQVEIEFSMPKPKSHPKTVYVYHKKRPDIDKLIRAVLDGLTSVIYLDDNQVVMVKAEKFYSSEPGVKITVRSLEEAKA